MRKVASIGGLTPPDQAVPETIKIIESMLDKARSGEIRSIAIVGVKANQSVVSCWHSEEQFHTLLGAASWLSYRMNEGS